MGMPLFGPPAKGPALPNDPLHVDEMHRDLAAALVTQDWDNPRIREVMKRYRSSRRPGAAVRRASAPISSSAPTRTAPLRS